MTLLAIISMLDKVLDLANRLAADMPADQKAQFWQDVKGMHDYWRGVADKLHGDG